MEILPQSNNCRPMVAVVAADRHEREALAALIWVVLGFRVCQVATLAGLNDRTAFAAVVVATQEIAQEGVPERGPAVLLVADSLKSLAVGQHRAVLPRPVDAVQLTQNVADAVSAHSSEDVQMSGGRLPAAFRHFS